MGIARHDMDESVLALNKGVVVDAAGVHLAEAELRPLCHESQRPQRLVVELFLVVVAGRGAVNHHRGSLDRLPSLKLRSVAQLFE